MSEFHIEEAVNEVPNLRAEAQDANDKTAAPQPSINFAYRQRKLRQRV